MADDFINGLGSGGDQPVGGGQSGGGTAAGTTADIQRNQILNGLLAALQTVFPQASSSVTHSATAGPDTLPAKPAGFLTITVSGVSYKVPLYNA